MRPPLNTPLFIRTPKQDRAVKREFDHAFQGKSVHAVHKTLASSSPLGGSVGMVRSQGQQWHGGWDIYAPIGTDAFAITCGRVVAATRQLDKTTGHPKGWGRYLVLWFHYPHYAHGLWALYGHLSWIGVSEGDRVQEGALIARTGNDGNAAGEPPHLHFEIHCSGDFSHDDTLNPGEVLGGHYMLHSHSGVYSAASMFRNNLEVLKKQLYPKSTSTAGSEFDVNFTDSTLRSR